MCVCVFRYVLLVSGLGMGSSWCDQLSLEMLVDYVTGQLGGPSVSMYIVVTALHGAVTIMLDVH